MCTRLPFSRQIYAYDWTKARRQRRLFLGSSLTTTTAAAAIKTEGGFFAPLIRSLAASGRERSKKKERRQKLEASACCLLPLPLRRAFAEGLGVKNGCGQTLKSEKTVYDNDKLSLLLYLFSSSRGREKKLSLKLFPPRLQVFSLLLSFPLLRAL